MRNLALFAIASLASVTTAQSPLNMGLTPNNTGNVGGGLYFDLTVNTTVTINAFRWYANAAVGANVSCNLWLGPSTYVNNVTDPSLWTLVGSTTTETKLIAGYEQMVAGVIPVPAIASVTLAPGTYGFALESVGASHGYTNGVGCAGSAPPGSCTNATGITAEIELRGGQAQNAFLAGGVFSPRIYAGAIGFDANPVDPPITFAAREKYGDGCYSNYQSIYEYWPNPASFDLENTSLLFTYDGTNNAYDITSGTTPVEMMPGGNPLSAPLGHGMDGEILIGQNTTPQLLAPILYAGVGGTSVALEVNMNADGFLTLQGSTPGLWTGANIVPDLLDPASVVPDPSTPSQSPARIGKFKFMDASTGTTHYDLDPSTGDQLFTWVAVSGNTYQIAFLATGDIELRFDTMSVGGGGGNPTVVGYILNNLAGALDPGSIDWDVATMGGASVSTQGSESDPLVLDAASNPIIGTTVDLTTSQESTSPGVGICFISEGILDPPVDLGIIGAPDCFAHMDLNQGAGFAIDNIPLNGMTVSFPIPNSTGIVGLSFYCQSAWLDASANAFGIITSNGLRLAIGSF